MQARHLSRAVVAVLVAAATLAVGPAPAGAAPASFVDDTVADFAAAPGGAGTWVIEPGAVRLQPIALSEGFDGPGSDLPASLTSVAWSPPDGTAAVGGGALTLDGVRVHPASSLDAPQELEFRATFTTDAFQHVGLGVDFDIGAWAMFSTGGGGLPIGLYARTRTADGTESQFEPIVGVDPLVPHTYRVEWSPTGVRYLVDGTQVASHAIAIATPMRPVASDLAAGAGAITIDWLGQGPDPASGVFESRVHDAGDERAVWGALTAATSGGGLIEIETRAGNTATPDATWSPWQPTGTGGAIASPIRRYMQYRATLSHPSGGSPSLDGVEIGYEIPAPPASGGGDQGGGGTTPPSSNPKPESDETAPAVDVLTRSARASRTGLVTLRMSCPDDEVRCRVTVQLRHGRASSRRKTVSILGGKAARVRVRLPKATRSLLAQRKRLRVTALVTARDDAGNVETIRHRFVLRAPSV